MDVEASGTQRRCNFESDEARADDDRLLCRRSFLDECTAVVKRANVVQLRISRPGDVELNGFRPRRHQQRPELEYLATIELNLFLPHIKCGYSRAEEEIDTLVRVVVR